MSHSSTDRLSTQCPCCHAELVLDTSTGQVLSHREAPKAPAGGQDFEGLLADLDTQKARAAATFEREVVALKDRDRLLEAKFEEALKRAEEDGDDATPPVRPWDLD